ncbi:MAG: hypothetical protein HY953_08080, partial [Candidatus Rokubacteria bacterium]|nr:hypothetical protein [Candidatus Rokubacteria bacterium]
DDSHFALAGLDPATLAGYFLTEEQGFTLAVFPINQRLRYLVPFADPEETLAYLQGRRSAGGLTLMDDGEKFGVWPGTHRLAYQERWLARFFEALLNAVALGNREPEVLSSLASRLARLDRQLTKEDRLVLENVSGGAPLSAIAGAIVRALDPDVQVETARTATGLPDPPQEEVAKAAQALLEQAAVALAANPPLRQSSSRSNGLTSRPSTRSLKTRCWTPVTRSRRGSAHGVWCGPSSNISARTRTRSWRCRFSSAGPTVGD